MSSRFFRWRIRRWEKYLADLKKQKISKLNDLKEIMDFNKNFRLLLTYSRNLESKEKIALFEGIDLHLLLKQQEDIKRYLDEMEAQKRKEIEKQKMAEEHQRRLEYEEKKKQMRKEKEELDALRRASAPAPTPSRPSVPQDLMSPRMMMSPAPPARPMGPVFKPVVNRNTVDGAVSVNASVNRWDKFLDFFMGQEDFSVACGQCGQLYRTMAKGDAEQAEFVCAKCGGLNSSQKRAGVPTPPTMSLASSVDLNQPKDSAEKEGTEEAPKKPEEAKSVEDNKASETKLTEVAESEKDDESASTDGSKSKSKGKTKSKAPKSIESLDDDLSSVSSLDSSMSSSTLRTRASSRGAKAGTETPKKDKKND